MFLAVCEDAVPLARRRCDQVAVEIAAVRLDKLATMRDVLVETADILDLGCGDVTERQLLEVGVDNILQVLRIGQLDGQCEVQQGVDAVVDGGCLALGARHLDAGLHVGHAVDDRIPVDTVLVHICHSVLSFSSRIPLWRLTS